MTISPNRPILSSTAEQAPYLEKVYAGLLGKLIGVYLGRPFEGWTYERISERFGEITRYVHEDLGVPLVVTDDDITGTLTFLRAIEETGYSPTFSAADIGHTWLNAIIESRTILWWGGYGMSTEHTAYLNLKNGIPAPQSGSISQNGTTVAEQIGAQIFIDGWAMLAPGDPKLAANYAGRAGSVSHDGEAIYAAQALAAMEAQAFVTSDIPTLLDTALSVIPTNCLIAILIRDLRGVHAAEPDWRAARDFVAANYGYDRYPGNCHVVPNHALIILALLYGNGDFDRSMMIVNTCGWDTDCNAGNLGCLLGIMNGLTMDERWRAPIADQLYLPTAEGGRAITDAAREAVWVANLALRLRGQDPSVPKGGARFHFELPGSVQGFRLTEGTPQDVALRNVAGHSVLGERVLELHASTAEPVQITTPTFSPLEALNFNGRSAYDMIASPTLYPGQRVTARVSASAVNPGPVNIALVLEHYDAKDLPASKVGSSRLLQPGEQAELEWTIPDLGGQPTAAIGLKVTPFSGDVSEWSVYLDTLTWSGTPTTTFTAPADGGTLWRQAWVKALDIMEHRDSSPFHLVQNRGRGMLAQGAREWQDYRVESTLVPHLNTACGLAVRVQGLSRYYAFLMTSDELQLVKMLESEQILTRTAFTRVLEVPYTLALTVQGNRLTGSLDGLQVVEVIDFDATLYQGAAAFVVEQGMVKSEAMKISSPDRF